MTTKVPKPLPVWAVKCIWRSTSSTIIVNAKDEAGAQDKAWKVVSHREGGSDCLEVKVLRQV